MFVFMSVHARYALPVAIDSAEFVFDFEVRDMEDLYSNEFRYTIWSSDSISVINFIFFLNLLIYILLEFDYEN